MKKPLRTRTNELGLSGQVNDAMFNYLTGEGSLADKLTAAGERAGVTTRYFTDFTSAAQSNVSLDTPILLGSQDFTVGIEFASTSGVAIVAAGTDIDSIVIDTEGGNIRAFARVGNTVLNILSTPSAPYLDGRLHRAEITYAISGAVSLAMDNQIVASDNWALNGSQAVSIYGARPARPSYFTGIIANAYVTVGASTILDMPIDKNYTTLNNTVTDNAGNYVGTFNGIADEDSKLYSQLPNGNWQDQQGGILEVAY